MIHSCPCHCSGFMGDCSLVRRFCSPKVRKSEIKGSSFRRFCSLKVRKSENEVDTDLSIPKVLLTEGS